MAIAQNKKSILAMVGILLTLMVLSTTSMGCCDCCDSKEEWLAKTQAKHQKLMAEMAAKQPPSSYVNLNPLLLPPIDVNPNTLSGDTFVIPGVGPGVSTPGGC